VATTKQLYTNNAKSTLAVGILSGTTTLVVATGEGSKFPLPVNSGDYFLVTLEIAESREIVKCTARSGDTLTVARAQEGTTAAVWPEGTLVQERVTKGTLESFARLVDRLDELSSLDSLVKPSDSNSNSYLLATTDDGGNPIVAFKRTSSTWGFNTHKKIVVTSTVTSATTTSITDGAITGALSTITSGKYIIQFTSGNLAGIARVITSNVTSTVNWTTATNPAATAGDSFEIYQSDYSSVIEAAVHDPVNLKLYDSRTIYNIAPVTTIAANALTITLKSANASNFGTSNKGYIAQRSTGSLSDASVNIRSISANVTLVISAGSTLGHTSARLCPVYVYLLDNAGTQELAVSGSFQGESGIFTTTTEGGAGGATSLTTMYSTTGRSSVAARLIAIMWSNQTTAGQWAVQMIEIKMAPFLLDTVGEIVDYGGGVVPYGFYLMDGSTKNRTTDARLFMKIGTQFGAGDGSTTFGIGDSRRKSLVGSGGSGTGTLGNTVGNTGGEETHTLTSAELPFIAAAVVGTGTNVNTSPGIAIGNVNVGGSATPFTNYSPSLVATRMIRWLGDL
jgi:microcystin-dependent protein